MKITVKKSEICEAVSNVQRAVSSKSNLAALEGILIKTKNGRLCLSGYDMELGIITDIEAQTEEPGSIILNARLFGDILRRLPEETVKIETDDKFMTNIFSGLSEFSILGINAEEFPEMPEVNEETNITLEAEMLKNMINGVIYAVALDDAKPVQKGVLFEITSQKLKLIAVDGYRLAIRSEPIKDGGDDVKFVVPGKTLNEMIKLVSEDENNIEIKLGRRHIIFKIKNFTVISRLLDGDFLDYRSAVSFEHSSEVTVNTGNLFSSVERISLLITDKLKSPVRCTFEDDTVKLRCTTAVGKAFDTLPCETNGERLEIGFNNRYFLDALKACEGDKIKIQLNGPTAPIKIVPLEGESFLYLVLPVRLKTE